MPAQASAITAATIFPDRARVTRALTVELTAGMQTVVFGELPKTSTGKIQKFELRQRAGSAQAIDV